MNVTKYAHACIVLEEQGRKLVIDPGGFTPELGDLSNIEAVVVTHAHPDHYQPKHIEAIVQANPEVQIYSVQEVIEQGLEATQVQPGQRLQAGVFSLEFWGEQHALIHQSIPPIHNTAVLVNDAFFYPGDSFTMPDKPVALLAVPASAPWMSVGQAMDYVAAVKPQKCMPTHNAILSEEGHSIHNRLIGMACEANGVEYVVLQPGESTEI